MNKENSQSGNVLFYILIAVALLAALSFAVSQSGRGSGKAISAERIKLAATEIIQYANALNAAVAQLQLRGCKDTEISFENNIVTTGYDNPNAPEDGFCNVFSINGGGVQWRTPESDWIDSTIDSGEYNYGVFFFTGGSCIEGVGRVTANCYSSDSTSTELLMALPYLKEEICEAINEKLSLGFSSIPKDGNKAWSETGTNQFAGTYSNSPVVIGNEAPELYNVTAACFEAGSYPEGYAFYNVLIPR